MAQILGRRQMRKITKPIISVVSTMVEVTAKPKAAASAVEDLKPSTRPITATQSSALTAGAKTWPRSAAEVWTIARRGRKPSWIACWVIEKAPVIADWLAITVAAV